MIIDDIADVFDAEMKKGNISRLGKRLDRHRSWLYNIRVGCCMRLDYKFIANLATLGYELKLVKKEGKK